MKLKSVINIIYALAILLLVVIASATILSVSQGPGGWHVFVVQSGSMEPAIKTGSVVVVVPQSKYQVNDIITFFADSSQTNLRQSNSTVTHRLVAINQDPDSKILTYQTQGDANNAPDKDPLHRGSILGRVVAIIPFLGYIIAFTKTQTGFLLLVTIPGTIIVYGELQNIKKEIIAILNKKKTSSKSDKKTN